jgi:hypothetical protein
VVGTKNPGRISVVPLAIWNLASGQGVPLRRTLSFPSKRIEARQVHSELLDVTCESRRVIARIEQDASPAVLDERREAPVSLQCRDRSEGVVQNRDACWLLRIGVNGRP